MAFCQETVRLNGWIGHVIEASSKAGVKIGVAKSQAIILSLPLFLCLVG